MEKKFAVLIDADNVSSRYIEPILKELSKHGSVTNKRIYGDWTNPQHVSWKEELLNNSITPIQQFSYTTGKNATDSAMIIDAMDILYSGKVDGFCIVSSDSDFTRLAGRIRETGLTVIGMGENKTPDPFRKACDIFTVLELLLGESSLVDEEKTNLGGKEGSVTMIEEAIVQIITENQNSGKETNLAEVGNRLVKLYPDFDARRYGYSLLSKFLEKLPRIEVQREGTSVTVFLKENTEKEQEVEGYIIEVLQKSEKDGIGLSELGQRVHERYEDFDSRDYGYSQFSKYIKSIAGIELEDTMKGLHATLAKD